MSLPDEEITRLFRVRGTVLQMLKDRGYAVEKSELEMTRKDFVQKFGENLKREDLLILKNKEKDSSDQVIEILGIVFSYFFSLHSSVYL